ncbi:MAG: cysteine desulfurase family protein [Eubacteriales bacterium]|nr:cysteine desulfurase family protein [Eubacteriales bacterium]
MRKGAGNIIYFDNSATTRPFDEVLEYTNRISADIYGNPSSLHSFGLEAELAIKKARHSIASALGASPEEIFFTSGATEANNLAVKGCLAAISKGRSAFIRPEFVTTTAEHPSVYEVYEELSAEGYAVKHVGVDGKAVADLDMLEKSITSSAAMISIMLVNNETGTIQDAKTISEIRERKCPDALLHYDVVQGFCKMDLTAAKKCADIMTVSSHKIHGPKGTGAIFIRKGTKLSPVMKGGGQEGAMRPGTENVPGICGFGLAADICVTGQDNHNNIIRGVREAFIKSLRENTAESEFVINSPDNGAPHILNLSFPGIKAEVLVHHLEREGIYISAGSACSSKNKRISRVMRAMGLSQDIAESAVRFSFSSFNTISEANIAAEIISRIIPSISTGQAGRRRGNL